MARMGEIIDGKYEVLREIGRGGMSVVYLAMDKRLNKQWAIKEFRKDKDDASKQVALKALLDEANLMKKLDHPTLPRIVDIIDNHQTVYVIMDYIEGESLNKVLDAYGAQPQDAVIEWAKQLSEVLDYLHTQSPPVIYRDMKPANIMLKPDGTVRLIDFGIAREYKEGKAGDTEAIGTRGYAAPEQFGGKGQTDARTDIYSLGVTLYHLLTGKNPAEPPYEIYPIRHWNPSFSSGLEWLIQKCTQLNPSDRYQSCAEVTYVLENLEKFDIEYKKKKKSRINLFLTSLILTIVFAIASVGLIAGSIYVQGNTYDEHIKNERFIEAILTDRNKCDGYVGLATQLTKIGPLVVREAHRETDGTLRNNDTIGTEDLSFWFPEDKMQEFAESNPKEYARIQFELGYLMWDRYQSGKEANQDAETIKKCAPYFESVMEVARQGKVDKYAGLQDYEFELAKIIYKITYFQNNRALFGQNENKDLNRPDKKLSLTPAAEFVGINKDEYQDNPYKAFWRAMVEVIDSLEQNPKITTVSMKVKVLDRVAYLFFAEHHHFFATQGIDVSEISGFASSFKTVYNSIDDEKYIQSKEEIKKDFNNAIKSINGSGVKLEEIE